MVDDPYRLVNITLIFFIKLFLFIFVKHQLIVDSASGLFRVDFCGRGELSERQVRILFVSFSKLVSVSF